MSFLLRNFIFSQTLLRRSIISCQSVCKCQVFTPSKLLDLTFKPAVSSYKFYAKGKDKPKEKGKKKIVLNESLLEEVINVSNLREQLEEAVENMKQEFLKHLNLRSSAGSIESVKVEFEGDEYILQDLGQISRKNPKTVIINMSSFPQLIPATVKALIDSGMNVNPLQEGTSIVVPIPKVTKEHRESLLKNSKAIFTKCKNELRDVQNKFIKKVKNKEKSEHLATDDIYAINEQLKFITDQYIAQAEKILEEKQKELKGDSK